MRPNLSKIEICLPSFRIPVLLASLLFTLSGCFEPPVGTSSNVTVTATSTPTTTAVVPGGARAAMIIFKNSAPSGSFDASTTGGTVPIPGSGQQATRVFNADGSLLASGGPGSSSWPAWLSSVEIGISGSANSQATSADCARFSNSNDTSATCSIPGAVATPTACGAPSGTFRVSERDCIGSGKGNGGPNDGVYVRATFSRNSAYLGTGENIMVVLQYSAWGINSPPRNPNICVQNGRFDVTTPGCSDMVWDLFIKHSTGEVVQPFVMAVPPIYGANNGTNPNGTTTRQFFLPLAGDPNLQVMQLSRIVGFNPNGTAQLTEACGTGNSAQCVGMVLYSMTFFRI